MYNDDDDDDDVDDDDDDVCTYIFLFQEKCMYKRVYRKVDAVHCTGKKALFQS